MTIIYSRVSSRRGWNMAVDIGSLKSFSLPSRDLLTVGEHEGQFIYATEDEFISVAASSGLQVHICISLL